MKRLWLIAILLILGCSSASAAEMAGFFSAPDIMIIAEEVSPEPVEPGSDVTLRIMIYNRGGAAAKNVDVKLNAQYPFYLKTESQGLTVGSEICSGCSKRNSYYFVVDADALSGIYPVKFTAFVDGKVKVEKEVNVRVTGVPDIFFESEGIDGLVKPGDVFQVNMTLSNIGTGKARNIKIIPQSADFISLGGGLQVLEELQANSSAMITLEFSVGKDTKPTSQNIPIDFTFLDENGASHNFTENLGVKLVNYAEVYLQNLKTIPSTIDFWEVFALQIRVENVGSGDAKNVKVVLESPLSGGKETYLGRLGKDDDAPGIFTLRAFTPGKKSNRLRISYTDDFGDHEVVEDFSLDVGMKSTPFVIFILVLLVGLAFLTYLLFFRKADGK